MAEQRTLHGLSAFCCLSLILMLIFQGEAAIRGVREGMRLCAHTMIPALLPLMVISEWMVRGNIGRRLADVPPLRFLCGLPGFSRAGRCAFLMGILCGFPIGGRVAAGYYRHGQLSEEEFSRLVCVCNLPSTAFLIGGVGVGLFGSVSFGRWLCVLTLLAALMTGVLFRFLFTSQTAGKGGISIGDAFDERGETHAFPAALAAAAESVLNVCVTVMLFCSLTRVLDATLTDLGIGIGGTGRAALLGFFELSGGVSSVASALPPTGAAIACAALIGWGGLSVHCQILAVCRGCPVPLVRFWFSRLLQAALCALGVFFLVTWGNIELSIPNAGETMAWLGDFPQGWLACLVWTLGCVGMVVGLLCLVLRKIMKRRSYVKSRRT